MLGLSGWLAALGAVWAAWSSSLKRRELVARACHELRAAITAVRLALELGGRAGELAPERLRAIELELGCAALALEDLGSAFGGERAPSSREHVSVERLLHDVVGAWEGVAAAYGAELRLGAVPCEWLYCDRRRVAQATGILVANAVEHGGGVVEVGGRFDADRVRIEVTDSGRGLPAPVTDLACEPNGRRARRGRGLAIASAIAASEGGRLSAAPSERGARLVLELPAA